MIIIVDVNVILSALIRESTTRNIIIQSNQDFCFPEPSLDKIRKYKNLILEKSGVSELEFIVMLDILFRFVRLIPKEELLLYWDKAKEIMEHIDPEDVTFVAAALSQNNAVLWSNDKHFDRQDTIVVFKTEQMLVLLQRGE